MSWYRILLNVCEKYILAFEYYSNLGNSSYFVVFLAKDFPISYIWNRPVFFLFLLLR